MAQGVKFLLVVLALLVLIPLVVIAIGFALPAAHSASASVVVPADRETVWSLVADHEGSAAWRDGVYDVRRLEETGDREAYEETNDFGTIRYEVTERRPPSRMVTRIIENEQFGGTWTYELETTGGGTRVTITEDGEIHGAFVRFMARFVFGHDGTLKRYLASLETVAGEAGR